MSVTAETIAQVVERIVEKVRPHRIYLFGSQARGDATAESDIDLLIVADMAGPRHRRNFEIRELFPLRKFSMDVFVLTPDEFGRQRARKSSPSWTAEHEGRVVYER